MDQATATILANEARKTQLRTAIAELTGRLNSTASAIGILSSQSTDAQRALQTKAAELAALEAGAGPGITDDFGFRADILAAFITQAQEDGAITSEVADTLRGRI